MFWKVCVVGVSGCLQLGRVGFLVGGYVEIVSVWALVCLLVCLFGYLMLRWSGVGLGVGDQVARESGWAKMEEVEILVLVEFEPAIRMVDSRLTTCSAELSVLNSSMY